MGDDHGSEILPCLWFGLEGASDMNNYSQRRWGFAICNYRGVCVSVGIMGGWG